MTKNKKKYRPQFTVILFLALAAAPLTAQERAGNWYLTLEQGKTYFRTGAYGDALRSFELARDMRKNSYAKMEKDLITVLSIHEVRLLGDDLGLLETYIKNRYRVEAAAALAELYYRVPKESLKNSSQRALQELSRLKTYPEAEYWIGESYRAEGELSIAIRQYQKAYDERSLLETKGFETGILYKMADVRRLTQEYAEMAAALETILENDALWSRESFDKSNMLKSLDQNGADRFLVLFRHNVPALERAHRQLGMYYYASGRHNRAGEHLLFSFLIQNTVIIEELKRDKYDYSFSGLAALQTDILRKPNLAEYLNSCEYFRTIYYLANALYAGSRRAAARGLWTFLANNAPAEWRGRAQAQLGNPNLDR
jgi:tetratricopeptide (TPR) repeat protein